MTPAWIAFGCGLITGIAVGVWILGLCEMARNSDWKICKMIKKLGGSK